MHVQGLVTTLTTEKAALFPRTESDSPDRALHQRELQDMAMRIVALQHDVKQAYTQTNTDLSSQVTSLDNANKDLQATLDSVTQAMADRALSARHAELHHVDEIARLRATMDTTHLELVRFFL